MIIVNNGHLKIKGKYPSGTRSFVMGTSPSDHKWKLNAKTLLKRFIYTEIHKQKDHKQLSVNLQTRKNYAH